MFHLHTLSNDRYVKLSSPNLNYLIITGAALLYTTVLLHVFSVEDQNHSLMQTILCNVCILIIIILLLIVCLHTIFVLHHYRYDSGHFHLVTPYALV